MQLELAHFEDVRAASPDQEYVYAPSKRRLRELRNEVLQLDGFTDKDPLWNFYVVSSYLLGKMSEEDLVDCLPELERVLYPETAQLELEFPDKEEDQ